MRQKGYLTKLANGFGYIQSPSAPTEIQFMVADLQGSAFKDLNINDPVTFFYDPAQSPLAKKVRKAT